MLFSLSFHSYNEKIIHLGYVFFRDPFHESLECALREELRAIPVDGSSASGRLAPIALLADSPYR